MGENILDPNQQVIIPGQNNEFDIVSDDIYYCMLDQKNYQDFTRCPWYMKLVKSNELVKDLNATNAKSKIKMLLKELKDAMGQF